MIRGSASVRQGTFVGFGFGAIQAGLFCLEAWRADGFERLVVADVDANVVDALRGSAGRFAVNIAERDRITTEHPGPVELFDPTRPAEREAIVDALAEAREVATAVPSVRLYETEGDASLHRLLGEGLLRGGDRRIVVYAAENDTSAAAQLRRAVLEPLAPRHRDLVLERTAFVDTVIGKMSGVVVGSDEIARRGLTPRVPGDDRAFLVEAFRRILVQRPQFTSGAADRGLSIFEEKDDLLPFEEAKLYGHNATHALAAYLARQRGYYELAEIRRDPVLLACLRDAFLRESGGALRARHAGRDALFTAEGWRVYVDDLLERMFNPLLGDSVERVSRDPRRKLGWNDRLVGTMRLALDAGIRPLRYARGVLAALEVLESRSTQNPLEELERICREADPDEVKLRQVLACVDASRSVEIDGCPPLT